VLDSQTAAFVCRIDSPAPNDRFALAPNGKVLATVFGTEIGVWDVSKGSEVCRQGFLGRHETIIGFTPDSMQIVTTVIRDNDFTLLFREAQTGKVQRELAVDPEMRFVLITALGGNKLLLSGARMLHLMDLTTGLSHKVTGWDYIGVSHLAFTPNCKMFAFAAEDGGIHVWETVTQKERCVFRGVEPASVPVAFSPDGMMLASGSTDSTILLWDLWGVLANRAPTQKLAANDWEGVWADLSRSDADKAFHGMSRMLAQPQATLAFLQDRIKPAMIPVEPAVIERFIKDLAHEKFAVRDKATAELAKLGEAAEVTLRQALQQKPLLEVRQRLEKLLRALDERALKPPPDHLRLMRAVEVVEGLGNQESSQLLKAWASGAPHAVLTREARRALSGR
jgi:hypothetical protein